MKNTTTCRTANRPQPTEQRTDHILQNNEKDHNLQNSEQTTTYRTKKKTPTYRTANRPQPTEQRLDHYLQNNEQTTTYRTATRPQPTEQWKRPQPTEQRSDHNLQNSEQTTTYRTANKPLSSEQRTAIRVINTNPDRSYWFLSGFDKWQTGKADCPSLALCLRWNSWTSWVLGVRISCLKILFFITDQYLLGGVFTARPEDSSIYFKNSS